LKVIVDYETHTYYDGPQIAVTEWRGGRTWLVAVAVPPEFGCHAVAITVESEVSPMEFDIDGILHHFYRTFPDGSRPVYRAVTFTEFGLEGGLMVVGDVLEPDAVAALLELAPEPAASRQSQPVRHKPRSVS
jgi:hypothetical protein